MAELIVPVEYNDFAALEAAVEKHKHDVGTILIEPVDFNCGCITPQPGFLEHARKLADENEMILFFDEIQSFAKKSPGAVRVCPDPAFRSRCASNETFCAGKTDSIKAGAS